MVFLFAFLLYSNTFNHSFTLDDEIYYSKNKYVQKGLAGISSLFTKGSTSGFKETGKRDLYRPLVVLSFAIEKEIFNNSPKASHVIQPLLYALACFLFYIFLKEIFSKYHPVIPLAIALLFASHPVHTEAAAGIKSRDELLSFIFTVLCLRNIVAYGTGRNFSSLFFALFFFFCALLSKESAVSLMVTAPLALFVFFSAHPSRSIGTKGSPRAIPLPSGRQASWNKRAALGSAGLLFLYCLIPLSLFVFLRMKAIPFSTVAIPPDLINNSLMAAETTGEMLATNFLLLLEYLQLLFFPFNLSYDYSYNQFPVTGWQNPLVIFSAVIFLPLLIYALRNLHRKSLIAFGILWAMISMFPVSNLVLKIDATIGLRFLFTPSAGVCMAAVLVIAKVMRHELFASENYRTRNFALILIPVLVIFSYQTFSRNRDWKNNFTLFSADVKKCPDSARIHGNLAFEYVLKAMKEQDEKTKTGFLKNAEAHYLQSLEIYPAFFESQYNLGLVYHSMNDTAGFKAWMYKSMELKPQHPNPYKEMGRLYYNTQQFDSAAFYLEKTMERNPLDAEAGNVLQYLKLILDKE